MLKFLRQKGREGEAAEAEGRRTACCFSSLFSAFSPCQE